MVKVQGLGYGKLGSFFPEFPGIQSLWVRKVNHETRKKVENLFINFQQSFSSSFLPSTFPQPSKHASILHPPKHASIFHLKSTSNNKVYQLGVSTSPPSGPTCLEPTSSSQYRHFASSSPERPKQKTHTRKRRMHNGNRALIIRGGNLETQDLNPSPVA